MKRSEMIKKISGAIKLYEDPGYDEEREDDADTLLSLLEKWGMLPPPSEIIKASKVVKGSLQWDDE